MINIQQVLEERDKIREQILNYRNQIIQLEAKLQKTFLNEFSCNKGDKMILHLLESRDDRVHCFQVEEKLEVLLEDIIFTESSDKSDNFFTPVVRLPKKKSRLFFNQFLSWMLIKDDKVIISHSHKDILIKGTYTEEEINEHRKCSNF